MYLLAIFGVFFQHANFSRDHSRLGQIPISIQMKTSEDCWSKVFTGRMPFLSPNKQCRSTEGQHIRTCVNQNSRLTVGVNARWVEAGCRQQLLIRHVMYIRCSGWWRSWTVTATEDTLQRTANMSDVSSHLHSHIQLTEQLQLQQATLSFT